MNAGHGCTVGDISGAGESACLANNGPAANGGFYVECGADGHWCCNERVDGSTHCHQIGAIVFKKLPSNYSPINARIVPKTKP